MIPEARAITPQSQTIHITDTHDDMFITEVGIGIDSSLVTIKDPNMDIRAFLVFRELEVNYWEPLKNATLRLHTSNTLDFDADSSITIYGMALSDLQYEGYLLPSTVLSLGFTSAHTDYNTSEFYENQWHEINVTSIVEELIRNPKWDGDGHAGTETGDAIGFHIVGAEGDDKRYFYDLKVGNGLEAQLVIHWNHEPPPPAGYEDADYNGTYRGYDIWTFSGSDFGWINYTEYTLYNISGGQYFEVVSDDIIIGGPVSAGPTSDFRLRRVNPGQFGTVLISVNITEVVDSSAAGVHWVGHLFGHANANKNVFNIDNDLDKGVFLTVSTPENTTDNIWRYAVETHNAGVWNLIYGQHYNASKGQRHYLNVTYNYPNQDFIVKVHSSSSFSDDSLIENINRTGYANIMTSYGNEFAFNTNSRPGDGDHFHFNTLSSTGLIWIVTDENGTTIDDGLDDYEDALILIDDILGADPEDPNPPGQGWDETGPFSRFRTRLYILLMGFGLLFGPLIYFAMRRPSGYEFVIGLFIMLVGYSFLRAAAGI